MDYAKEITNRKLFDRNERKAKRDWFNSIERIIFYFK